MSEKFIMYEVKQLVADYLDENIWIIINELNQGVIVDPGKIQLEKIIEFIDKYNLTIVGIINTHGHPDHIATASLLQQKLAVPFFIHEKEKIIIKDLDFMGQMVGLDDLLPPEKINFIRSNPLKIADFEFNIVHTPGHTPGSICLMFDTQMISGDTLFRGSVGRVDLPGGSIEEMKKSIEKIKQLDLKIKIYPGHGPVTTLKEELVHNPYFNSL